MVRAGEIVWPSASQLPPDGESGEVRIERFTVSEADSKFTALRESIGHPGSFVAEGEYVRLFVNGGLMMSSTPQEGDEMSGLVRVAHGHILIAGLGLGMSLPLLLANPEVEKVTVIEINPDVIRLVAPFFEHEKLEVIEADFLTWRAPRGARFNMVWIDIWQHICADDFPQAAKLKRKYKRRLVEDDQRRWIEDWLTEARWRRRL